MSTRALMGAMALLALDVPAGISRGMDGFPRTDAQRAQAASEYTARGAVARDAADAKRHRKRLRNLDAASAGDRRHDR